MCVCVCVVRCDQESLMIDTLTNKSVSLLSFIGHIDLTGYRIVLLTVPIFKKLCKITVESEASCISFIGHLI